MSYKSKSYTQLVIRQFKRNKPAVFSVYIIITLFLVAIFQLHHAKSFQEIYFLLNIDHKVFLIFQPLSSTIPNLFNSDPSEKISRNGLTNFFNFLNSFILFGVSRC